MTAQRPLLSIVIASRNRAPYAISAIKSILDIEDPRLELVIQDNSDTRDLELYTQGNIRDGRLRYRYTPPPFSSIANFNAAVELATGDYVCVIGDDDGVNPEILEAAAWAKSADLDSLAITLTAHYLWSGTSIPSTFFTKVTGSSLSVSPFEGRIRDTNLETEMRKLVRNGGLYYLNFDLPKLYHGLVHRRCLETVRERTGAYFGGLSPDIFASLAIACIAKRVAVTDYPLTIPGACGVSSSVVEGSIRRHSTRLEDAPHFRDRGEYRWSTLVPRVYTPETIWVDSEVAALRAMGREDLINQINLPKLAAFCIQANWRVAGPVFRHLFNTTRGNWYRSAAGAVQFGWSLVTGPGVKFAHRAWNRVLLTLGVRHIYRIEGLSDMVQASRALTRFLKEADRSFAASVRMRGVGPTSISSGLLPSLPKSRI
jgi:glycosyltransferase involved in cell wall biosynthesis